jgi:hypothetical protein
VFGEAASGSRDIITSLQSILLTCVLRRQPLPGQTQPVWFPDLAFITESPSVLISDSNLTGQFDIVGIDKPVEFVPESRIREAAARSGDRAYVRFQPAEEVDGQIRVVMEVRIAPTEPDLQALGLAGIRATFARGPDGNWEVTEPPAVFGI